MPPKKTKTPAQQQQHEAAAPVPSPKLQAKARTIRTILDHLFPDPPIPLDHKDTFTLLIAVILSAQTTDGKVNQVTPELFRLAPTPQALAAMPYDKVLSIIRSVGLAPGKTKNIINAAKQICERFDGKVPNNFEDLESLSGVGHKTASVVMTQAFGHPALPVDTHVHRLAQRWGLSKSQDVKKVEADLKALFPAESWAKVGLQMIYFGREHCAAKAHVGAQCPICSWASGSKPAPLEGSSIAEFMASFGPSPAKANKHIILYSERAAVEGTAMLGPVTLKMEAEADTKVKVEIKEEAVEKAAPKQLRGRRGAAAVKTEITTTTATAMAVTVVAATAATGGKRKAAARAPAKKAAAGAAAAPASGKPSRKRGASAATTAAAATTRAGKRAKRT